MKIVVDAMGTDDHPAPDVAGAVLAAQAFDETMILVGARSKIQQELDKHDTTGLSIEIVHADDSITMADKPHEVLRGKPQSSMHVGIQLVKNGEADAFVTCGNTGAALAVSMFQLKRIAGVKRPAITAVGELGGHLITVVDVGANTDTRIEWLQQFAMMGNLYSERVLGVKNPRVGLLSN
ncbi:MAG: phosphate--acyl-ACP acyltransferase, partial [Chloroflexota bacterium]